MTEEKIAALYKRTEVLNSRAKVLQSPWLWLPGVLVAMITFVNYGVSSILNGRPNSFIEAPHIPTITIQPTRSLSHDYQTAMTQASAWRVEACTNDIERCKRFTDLETYLVAQQAVYHKGAFPFRGNTDSFEAPYQQMSVREASWIFKADPKVVWALHHRFGGGLAKPHAARVAEMKKPLRFPWFTSLGVAGLFLIAIGGNALSSWMLARMKVARQSLREQEKILARQAAE